MRATAETIAVYPKSGFVNWASQHENVGDPYEGIYTVTSYVVCE